VHDDTRNKLVALFVGGPALMGYLAFVLFAWLPLALLATAAVVGG